MTCNVKITGLESLQNTLDTIKKIQQTRFKKKVLTELASIGITECEMTYLNANFDGQDISDYVYDYEWINDHSLSVYVNGSTVTFLEFGTGVFYNQDRDYARADEMGMIIGEYGKGHGKKDFWLYPAENNPGGKPFVKKDGSATKYNITHGTPAAYGMWYALESMRDNVLRVIKEALNDRY